jgi:hypothetical protein
MHLVGVLFLNKFSHYLSKKINVRFQNKFNMDEIHV